MRIESSVWQQQWDPLPDKGKPYKGVPNEAEEPFLCVRFVQGPKEWVENGSSHVAVSVSPG
jgi:hypothetical protein